jgi:hypothetical protein
LASLAEEALYKRQEEKKQHERDIAEEKDNHRRKLEREAKEHGDQLLTAAEEAALKRQQQAQEHEGFLMSILEVTLKL